MGELIAFYYDLIFNSTKHKTEKSEEKYFFTESIFENVSLLKFIHIMKMENRK